MLKLERVQGVVNAVTPIAKKIGNSGAYEVAINIHFIFISSASHLDEMDKGLRKALYKKATKTSKQDDDTPVQADFVQDDKESLIALKFGKKLSSLKWDDELEGYTLIAGSGLTATDPRNMDGVKLKNFNITAQDGGTVKYQCSASFECDREPKGWWCEQLRSTLYISLLPPGVEQSEAFEEEVETEVEE